MGCTPLDTPMPCGKALLNSELFGAVRAVIPEDSGLKDSRCGLCLKKQGKESLMQDAYPLCPA